MNDSVKGDPADRGVQFSSYSIDRQSTEIDRLTKTNWIRPCFGIFWRMACYFPKMLRLGKFIPAHIRPFLADVRQHGQPDPSRSFRLVIVSHELTASGAPKLVFELSLIAIEMGIQPVVISPTAGKFLTALTDIGAVVIIDPTVTDYFCASSALLDASPVVILNTALCFKTVSRISKTERCIWYFHETDLIEELLAAPEFPIAVRRVQEVWAVSDATKTLLERVRSGVLLVPPGIRPLPSKRKSLQDHTDNRILRLALIGSIEERKGHDILASALLRLPDELANLILIRVIGPLKDEQFAQRWLDQIKGLRGIRYEGAVDPSEIGGIIDEVDGVIIPSREEPFSLVALEAMSCGKLVFCSQRCGVSGYLTDSFNAYIATEPHPDDLARLLIRALQERSRWNEIGAAGNALFLEKFSSAAFADRLRTSLSRLLSSNGEVNF
jgi:O-antigen biosynthesis protein